MNTSSESTSSEARTLRRLALALAAIAIASLGIASLGRAQSVDPSLPQRLVVGPPSGHAPLHRVDAARTGRSTLALPSAPKVLWRARAQGGVHKPVAVDELGAIVVAGDGGQLSQLSRTGKLEWTLGLGGSRPLTGPVILGDGARVVLGSDGELSAVDPSGKLRRRQRLPVAMSGRAAPPLPLSDGGLALGVGSHVLLLEATGALRGQANAPAAVEALVQGPAGLVFVTERGDVFGWQLPAAPRRIGSFGGRADEGAAAFGGRLLAVVNRARLVELDLTSGALRVLADLPSLQGPPAIARSGHTRITTYDGLLLGHDRTGKETLRVSLEPGAGLADAGASLATGLGAPPVLVDASGRVGFARPDVDFGVVDTEGKVKFAAGASCVAPVGLVPAGQGRMLVACASGILWMLGDSGAQ
jgi:hypothetical protein